jgi:hypothetical protein
MLPSLLAAPLLLLSVPTSAAQDRAAPPIALCEVRVGSPAELARLFRAASDPDDHFPVRGGVARVFATPEEERRLRALGFDVRVLRRDLAAFYAARAADDQSRLVQGGSMGGFKTLAEIVAEMDRLAATYPAIVSPRFSIGTSVEGRSIWAMRLSDDPAVEDPLEPRVFLDAIHHAREPMGGEALLLFADSLASAYPADPDVRRMVETRDVVFVPCVNPDGYEHNRATNPGGGGMWRKNRRNNGNGTFGIDLNRNYGWEWGPQWPGSSGTPGDDTYRGPSPFSEPETRAVRDWQLAHPPAMSLSAHTYGNLWLFPWGYDIVLTQDDARYRAWSEVMTATNGFEVGSPPEILYVANGVSLDWSYGQLGTFAFSPEIGSDADGFWPAPSAIQPLYQSVAPALRELVRWSGAWPEVRDVAWTEVHGDGDAWREAGETWDLAVGFANFGIAPASGTLTLASTHPQIAVLNGLVPFQVDATVFPATHLQGGLPGVPPQPLRLRIAIAPGAAAGSYDLDLGVRWDGLTTPTVLPVAVGQPRVLARDDMEIAGFGWQVDNATNWSWQRAAPQATTSGGQTVQPGEDDPATTGTLCWVTGAAAGSGAGSNDVDGVTTLTSPLFTASGFSHLRLAYARWYADLPGSATDDQLLVQVSNDGGASWTTLETTANANAWRAVGFDLESVLPPTDRMRLRFTASDNPSNSLCEALVDSLVLSTFSDLPTLGEWGATNAAATARLFVDGPASVPWRIRMSTSAGPGQSTGGTAGLSYLTGTVVDVASGTTAASGRAELPWTVPSGTTLYLQALLDEGGPQAAWSNLLTVVVP